MKIKFLIIIQVCFVLSGAAFAKEDCSPGALEFDNKTDIAEKLFFTGTCHYRNEDYRQSAENWQKLAELESVEKAYQDLQIDALNNLGYLMFFGLGIDKNQNKAVAYWKKAVALGQTESEYHLCHAYADNKESTYDRDKAKTHCKKALLIYRGMQEKDEEILSDIENYYDRIK